MASQTDVFGEVDDHEDYLAVIAKEAKEALLDRKVKEMQKKNRDILKRHAEVEADRKAAEDSGCAVTMKSSQPSVSDVEKPEEAIKTAEDEDTKPKGRGQSWGRPRSRGPRSRPHGNFGQNAPRNSHARESESFQDAEGKRVSPSSPGNDAASCDKHSSSVSSPRWDAGPPENSGFHSHDSQTRPYNSQRSKETNQGQRYVSGRGNRGPHAKFVTVPDASHSHDVRHVEEINDSIVINVDRSVKPGTDSSKRGGGRGGAGRGRTEFSNAASEDGASQRFEDRDGFSHGENALPYRGGYRGRGRRPFRGRGDGSYRGHGRGEGYRRGHGDGPRPFRGGYKGDWSRGRPPRRAVIVTPKNEGELPQAPDEDWDKEMTEATAGGGATNTVSDSMPGANYGDGRNEEMDRNEACDSGHHADEDSNEYQYDGAEESADQNQEEEDDVEADERELVDSQPCASAAADRESFGTGARDSGPSSKKSSEVSKSAEGQSKQPEIMKETVQPLSNANVRFGLEDSKTVLKEENVNPQRNISQSSPEKPREAALSVTKDAVKQTEPDKSTSHLVPTQHPDKKETQKSEPCAQPKSLGEQQKSSDEQLKTKAGSEQPKITSEQPKSASEQPKSNVQQPKSTVQQPKTTGEQPKSTVQQPKSPTEQPKTAGEQPKSTVQQPKSAGEQPKSTVLQPKSPTEQPKLTVQHPSASEQPKTTSEQPKSTVQQPKSPTEQPKSAVQQPKSASEQPKLSGDQLKSTTEQPKSPTVQQPKSTSEQPKSPTEQTKSTVQQTKSANEQPKTTSEQPKSPTEQAKSPVQQPKSTTEQTKAAVQQTKSANEPPKTTSEQPKSPAEQPKSAVQQTKSASEQPSEQPKSTVQQPISTTEQPKSSAEKPSESSTKLASADLGDTVQSGNSSSEIPLSVSEKT